MGLLDKLNQDGSNLSKFNGTQPDLMDNIDPTSPVHNTYSVNENPSLTGYPAPTDLSLGGVTPTQYLDNLPN